MDIAFLLHQARSTASLIHSRLRGICEKFDKEPNHHSFDTDFFKQTIDSVHHNLKISKKALDDQYKYYRIINRPQRPHPPPQKNITYYLTKNSNIVLPPLPPDNPLSSTTITPIPPHVAPIPAGFEDDTPLIPIEIFPIPFEDDIISLLASENIRLSPIPSTSKEQHLIAPEYYNLYQDDIVTPEHYNLELDNDIKNVKTERVDLWKKRKHNDYKNKNKRVKNSDIIIID